MEELYSVVVLDGVVLPSSEPLELIDHIAHASQVVSIERDYMWPLHLGGQLSGPR